MCLDFDDRESIVKDAKEAAGDMIRNAAWRRAKAELEIMLNTFQEADRDKITDEFKQVIEKFTKKVEDKCFHI